MSNESFKAYLLSLEIPAEDKKYALQFFKKNDYFDVLRKTVNQDTNENVLMGYGNFNSKISFVMQDQNVLETIKPLLMGFMNKFNVNFWDIYLTFVHKVNENYIDRYSLLTHELHAVNPEVLYLFVDDENSERIINEFYRKSFKLPTMVFNIGIPPEESDIDEYRKNLFKSLKYLINYK